MTNKRLYLDNWSYNAAIILQELETIVLNNGGAIVSTWKTSERDTITITNRTLDKSIRDCKERLERYTVKGIKADSLREEIARLEAIKNDPITLYYGDYHYICFTIGNDYYYYSIDRNPFSDFHYGKQPINSGAVAQNYYLNLDSKKWLNDILFTFKCSQDDRRDAAINIYNMLINASYCGTYRDKHNRKPKIINVLKGEKTWMEV